MRYWPTRTHFVGRLPIRLPQKGLFKISLVGPDFKKTTQELLLQSYELTNFTSLQY